MKSSSASSVQLELRPLEQCCVQPGPFSALTAILHTPHDLGSSGWENHPPGFSPAFSLGETCEPGWGSECNSADYLEMSPFSGCSGAPSRVIISTHKMLSALKSIPYLKIIEFHPGICRFLINKR